MTIFEGACLCNQIRFTAKFSHREVVACHCTSCQRRSGGMAMYLEADEKPLLLGEEPKAWASSEHGLRTFCPECGCPIYFYLPATEQYFVSYPLLHLPEEESRRLILAAEIHTENQPAFWRLTGQYARFSGAESEDFYRLRHHNSQ